MLQDPDIHRAARHLIDNYGSSAATVAERRAINMEQSGSDSAAKTWQLIARIVRQYKRAGTSHPLTPPACKSLWTRASAESTGF
jgi:hypothetical protein